MPYDNNYTESEIKRMNSLEKNSYCQESEEGERTWCLYSLLIFSVKRNKLDSYQYNVEIMKATFHCQKAEDNEVLLVWNMGLNRYMNKVL